MDLYPAVLDGCELESVPVQMRHVDINNNFTKCLEYYSKDPLGIF